MNLKGLDSVNMTQAITVYIFAYIVKNQIINILSDNDFFCTVFHMIGVLLLTFFQCVIFL